MSEVAKSVRMDLRRLASLFITFKQVLHRNPCLNEDCNHDDSSSLLVRSHFYALEDAINIQCTDCDESATDAGLKAGLKIAIYYLLKKWGKNCQSVTLEMQ